MSVATTQQKELVDAIAHEQQIAEEAKEIRTKAAAHSDKRGLTPELFAELLPLLKRPIPAGFIKEIGKVTGKPYDSTGVSSVQVQIERMDNVLGPLGWEDTAEYMEEGKLCRVTVRVIGADGVPLCARESYGGVDRASTLGNLYKGSYTNAAKVAFARVGPGHEVYLGATDLDPDVSEAAALEQAKPERTQPVAPRRLLTDEERAKVVKGIQDAGYDEPGQAAILKAVCAEGVDQITYEHAFQIRALIDGDDEHRPLTAEKVRELDEAITAAGIDDKKRALMLSTVGVDSINELTGASDLELRMELAKQLGEEVSA